MHHNFNSKQKGAAIIVALFVTALVATAAAAMIFRLQTDVRRTELMLNSNQAYFAVQGSIAWAKDQLLNNLKQQKPNIIVDNTPIHSPIDQVNGMQISNVIYDAQGYLNINNITDPKNQDFFFLFFKSVAPTLDENAIKEIMVSLMDWVSDGVKNSALEEYYLKQNPPYRSPHHLMVSISELRLVKGITAEIYSKIEKNAIALPNATLININNANQLVLLSLGPKMTLPIANSIMKTRLQKPFGSTNDFINYDPVKNAGITSDKLDKLTVLSDYFLLESNVTVGKQHLIYYSLLKRTSKDAKPLVSVLWQMQGTM